MAPQPSGHICGLSNRRVVVTGGSTGIGRALVRQLVGGRARAFTAARHQEELDAAVTKGEGEVIGSVDDMTNLQGAEWLFREANEALGRLAAVVCAPARTRRRAPAPPA